jgi:hypothetical protein
MIFIPQEVAMKTLRFALVLILFVAFFATASLAQNARTFVSGAGLDTNPCSLTSPCRTFTQAIAQTNAGGEVVVLTSAGYGPFTINKALTVEAPAGVYAGITVPPSGGLSTGNGIDINAGPEDLVILRGLTVNNQGSGGSGVVFHTGNTVLIESCIINGFLNGAGVDFLSEGSLQVTDSIITFSGSGIFVTSPGPGAAFVSISRVRLESNAHGLLAEDGAKVTARDCVSSTNNFGFQGLSNGSASLDLNIENCLVSNNFAAGIASVQKGTPQLTIRVSNSTVTGNTIGFDNISGTFQSRGDNTVDGNITDVAGAIVPYFAR